MSRCTKCSAPAPPVLAVDIDGTLAEYHENFRTFCSKFYDRPSIMEAGPYRGGELSDSLLLTKEEYRTAKLAYRQGGGKRMMPIISGAGSFIDWANWIGFEIWITTTRPYNRFDSTDPDTRHWLDKHSIHWNHLLYDEDKYARLTEQVDTERVVCVVEDLPENVSRASQLNLHSVLMSRPYNRDATLPSGCQRADNFAHATMIVNNLLEGWKANGH